MSPAQNQVYLSLEAFSKAVATVKDEALFLASQHETILTWNSGAEILTGYQAAAVIGRPLSILTRGNGAGRSSLLDHGALSTNGQDSRQVEINRPDGSALRVAATVTLLEGQTGSVGLSIHLQRVSVCTSEVAQYLDAVHEAIILTDLDGFITYWNNGATQLFGWTAEEMVGRNYADRFPEPVRTHISAEIRKRALGDDWDGEYEDHRKDGTRVWIDARVRRVFDATGKPVGILGISHDITERKRTADAERKEINEQYANLFDRAVVGIFRSSPDGRYLVANHALAAILGYDSPDELLAAVTDIGHQVYADPEQRAEILRRLTQQESMLDFECECRRKNGTSIWVRQDSRAVRDGTGKLLYFEGFIQDVTERKRVEAALYESESRLRMVLEGMPVMLDAFNASGDLVAWNQECERVSGYTAAEMIGNPNAMKLLYPDPEYRQKMLGEWAGRGDYYRWEWDITCKSGEVRTISWSNISTSLPMPGWTSWGIGWDVTDRKREEMERRLSEFAMTRASVAAYLIAPDARILRVNQANCHMLGYTENELTRMTVHDVNPNFPAEKWPIHWQDLRMNKHLRFESHLRHKDGHTFPVDIEINYLEFEGQEYNFAFARDITERKRAEADLRESEERYRVFVDHAIDAFFLHDHEGKIIDVNHQACESLGYTREELIGKAPFAFDVDLTSEQMAEIQRQLAAGLRPVFESRHRRKDGLVFPVEVRIRPFELRGQRHAISLSRNITNQKNTEEALRASESQFRLFMNHNPAAAWITDANARMLYLSDTYRRMFQMSSLDPLGKSVFDLYPADIAQVYADNILHVAQTNQTLEAIEPGTRADGSLGKFLVYKFPLSLPGAAPSVGGLAVDITERERADEELQLRDRAIRAVNQGILISDPRQPDNPVIYVSPGFERMTGYTASEVIGRNCRFLQGQDTDPAALDYLRESIRIRRPCTVELLNYRKDGTPFWNELSVSPVWGDDGCLTHFVGVQADVTERRRLEEQLRQSQKMDAIGRLAGGVAHDFNNLLTIINGYAEILLGEISKEDSRRERLVAIQDAGERAALLTSQLLAFSRKSIVEPKIIDLNQATESAVRILRRLVGDDVRLKTELTPDVAKLKIDPGQLDQLFINLAVNARDAMPGGGLLTIATANVHFSAPVITDSGSLPVGHYVQLVISDTGEGMSEEIRSQIFEPFFTTKKVGKGTGLGLATVYGIVQQAGGLITVESELGRGASFRILLPAIGKIEGSVSDSESEVAPQGTETILLVEDAEALRRLARLVLEMQGYKILEAESGPDAVRLAATHRGPIDLLVTDVVMPHLGGRELAAAMCATRPETKVLYMSGYTNDSALRHGVETSMEDFLQKPFTPMQLAQKVREVLDAPTGRPGVDGG